MTEHVLTLTEFTDPPLIEVVVGVQFEKLEALTAAHIGRFWEEVRDEFPETQDKPPLAPAEERFDGPKARSLQLVQQTTPRVWFLESTASKIIQLQNDRFLFNWRRATPQSAYPRYSQILADFLSHLRRLSDFSLKHLGKEIVPRFCELNYINHIHPGNGWSKHSEIGEVFAITIPHLPSVGLEFEEGRLNLVYRLPKQNDKHIGRLRVSVEPRVELSSGTPIFVLEIGARGYAWNEGLAGTEEFLNLAHSEIVPAFEAVTTERMHRIWGKKDAAHT